MEEFSPRTSVESTAEDPGVAMTRNDEVASQTMPPLLPEEGEKDEGPQFARAKMLSQYIPELDPSNPRAITLRVKMARRMTMLKLQLAISSLVVVSMVAITIWSVAAHTPNSRGVGTYLFGDCPNVSILNSGLHVALNILSGLLLSSGSYCMQLLISPSRHEVDEAHSKGVSLKIGIPNVTNLWHIDRGRVVGWLAMGVTAALLHLVWNSSIFTSLPVVSIPRAIATTDFQEATDNWTIDNPLPQRPWWKFPSPEKWGVVSYDLAPIYTLKTSAANLTRLETKECINEYLNPLESTRAVLVVAQNMTTIHNNGSSLLDGWMAGWDDWDGSNYWLCSAYDPGEYSKICTPQWADTLDDWIVGIGGKSEGLPNVVVNYCLVSDGANNEDRCGLHYSAHIMVIVCICTFLECLFILRTGLYFRKYDPTEGVGRRRQSLVTVGDAIADFSHEPIAQDNTGPKIAKGTAYQLHIRQWEENRSYWFTAVSTPTWAVSFILFAIGLAVPSGLIGAYISRLKTLGMDLSLPEVWRLGFKANPAMIGHSFWQSRNKGSADLIVNVLIANSPQVIMSFIYLFSNAILTRQLVADEWVRFIHPNGKKPLRVTSPVGIQRSSYFLSLPLKYSSLLMMSSILLHWFISQGIFLVQTSSFGPGPAGQRHSEFDVSARGYSALEIILATTLWAVFVIALIIHSFAREFRGIPCGFHLMGMSSAGIGLMCTRPEGDSDAYLFPVSIGVLHDKKNQEIERKGKQGHLAFSTHIKLEQPKAGCWYLQPTLITGKAGRRRALKEQRSME
ncbi:hypothetical protein DL770_006367 [Monosporascus sp. CRB-9-2]|nr:hypothetical protein DL770_006367 [Monosporascus sp. CRB-9-2]